MLSSWTWALAVMVCWWTALGDIVTVKVRVEVAPAARSPRGQLRALPSKVALLLAEPAR